MAVCFNFATNAYLARSLTEVGFGKLAWVQAVTTYLALFVNSGLSIWGALEVARRPGHVGQLIIKVVLFRLVLSVVLLALLGAIITFWPLTLELRWLLIGSALWMFPFALNTAWVFQGLERMEFVGMSTFLDQALYFGLSILWIRDLSDLDIAPLSRAAASLVVSFLLLFALGHSLRRAGQKLIKIDKWWHIWRRAIRIGAALILANVYCNFGTILLGIFKPPEMVGWFNAAFRLFFFVLSMQNLLLNAAYPTISRLFYREKQRAIHFAQRYLEAVINAVVLLAVVFTVVADHVIGIIYGSKFIDGTIALRILIWCLVPIAISGVYGYMILLPNGNQREFLFAIATGAISNVSLNFILVRRFDHAGAAMALLFTEVIVACVMYLLSQKVAKVNFLVPLLSSLSAGIVTGVAVFILGFFIPFSFGKILLLLTKSVLVSMIYLLLLGTMGFLKLPIQVRNMKAVFNFVKSILYLLKYGQ